MTTNAQERFYDAAVDYRHGSPHLTHLGLYDRLVGAVRDELAALGERGLPLTVLELGAGHGGYTEPVLAAGARVTALEMSRASVEELRHRFGRNDAFRVEYTPDGAVPEGESVSLGLAVSVLHHVPDYLAFLGDVSDAVRVGGSLIALQDPMWYPRHRGTHAAARAAYLAWRLRQGHLSRGVRTIGRRVRGVYDDDDPSDTVEYHSVRQGVDEEAVCDLLRGRFEQVELLTYWATQSPAAQRLGERLGLRNMFGVIAKGRR